MKCTAMYRAVVFIAVTNAILAGTPTKPNIVIVVADDMVSRALKNAALL